MLVSATTGISAEYPIAARVPIGPYGVGPLRILDWMQYILRSHQVALSGLKRRLPRRGAKGELR